MKKYIIHKSTNLFLRNHNAEDARKAEHVVQSSASHIHHSFDKHTH